MNATKRRFKLAWLLFRVQPGTVALLVIISALAGYLVGGWLR